MLPNALFDPSLLIRHYSIRHYLIRHYLIRHYLIRHYSIRHYFWFVENLFLQQGIEHGGQIVQTLILYFPTLEPYSLDIRIKSDYS